MKAAITGGAYGGGIWTDGDVEITACTLSANTADFGGSVSARGNVILTSSTIAGNTAEASGGGVRADGDVTVISSTIAGNSAEDDGGGISASGDITVVSSAISGNSADYNGGGMYAQGEVMVAASTIAGNSTEADGGGIYARGEVTVISSTIAGNSARYRGGGIYAASAGQLVIAGSIVAANTDDGTAPDLNVRLGTLSVEYSLIGDNTGTDLIEAPVGAPDENGNLIGGAGQGIIDPLLAPLADNGGPTLTLALLAGSPAIDAGDPAAMAGADEVPLYDQRDEPYARVASGNGAARIDMGSYEQQSLQGEILAVASPTTTAVAEVTIQFSSPVSGFDLADLELSLNGGDNLLTGSHTLSTSDDQTFVLGGLADVTAAGGYYTLQLIAPGSQIVDANGGPLDSSDRMSWAMGRTELGLTVNTLVDEADGSIDDGDVSLRDAIAAAAPGETIEFDTSLNGGTILLSLGELSLTRPITIDATGLTSGLIIDAAGNDPTPELNDGQGSRIFNIDDGNLFGDSPVTLRGMTLTGGDVSTQGGAIRGSETLTLESAAISENAAYRHGGGIWNSASVTINASTISGNTSGSDGGGIWASSVVVSSSTFSANSADDAGGGIFASGDATIGSSTIAGNSAEDGGGVYADGDVTVTSSTISGNSADYDGGGIYADGDLTVTSSTIAGNSADYDGGGIYAYGDVRVTSSTISGNSAAYDGGGIHADGEVTVTSSTIAGNSAFRHGGGIYADSDVTVISSTIAGNSAVRRGGGIYADSVDQVTIENSIVALNTDDGTAPDLDVGGGTLSVEYSLIGDSTGTDLTEAPVGAPDENGNLIGGAGQGTIDPFLAPLADNGGPTLTLALLAGSPAIDAGDPAAMAGADEVPLYDQRGEPYARVASGNGAARIDMGSYEQQSLTVEILAVASPTTTVVDEVTIQFSSPASGFDLADLKLSLNGGDNLLTSSHTLSTSDDQTFVLGGLADVTAAGGYYTLQLIAPGSQIVDANGRPLDSSDSTSWAMGRTELRLTVDTLVDEADGSIDDGDVSLRDAIAAAAPGETIEFDTSLDGGTILLSLGELSLTRPMTIDATGLTSGLIIDAAGNDPTPELNDGQGSRIFNIDDGNLFGDSPVTLRGMTLTGGDVSTQGGAIRGSETLTLESAAISENAAYRHGGGIWNSASVTISASTISGNTSGSDGGGIWASNVVVNSSTFSANSADDDGGGIWAVDATVSFSTFSDNSADYAGGGIFASGDVTIGSSTIAGNSAYDGGGIRALGDALVHSSTITENSAADVFFGGSGISASGEVTISSSMISGNSAESGSAIHGGHVRISSSTISQNRGGGIQAFGDVAVNTSTISGNSNSTAYGGGIQAYGDVTVSTSTITGNSAGGQGGGVFAHGNVTMNSSTIAGNSAGRDGGGIYARGEVTATSSTIAGNLAGGEGGGISTQKYSGQDVTIENSIVAGNTDDGTAPDLNVDSGTLGVQYSLIGDNTGTDLTEVPVGVPDENGNLIGGSATGTINPLLGPLADNGGPTLTLALLPGSPALNAGDSSAMAGIDDVPLYDQRGERFGRVSNGRIDMGALEVQVERLAADFNDDGHVDGDDFLIWQIGFNQFDGNAMQGDGDADEDGFVDSVDFRIWQNMFGSTSSPGNIPALTVPAASGAAAHSEVAVRGASATIASASIPRHSGAKGAGVRAVDAVAVPSSEFEGGPGVANDAVPLDGNETRGRISDTTVAGGVADHSRKSGGGLAPTHTLLPGSLAIDAGDPTAMAGEDGVPLFDQRGEEYDRVVGGSIDRGAFEVQPLRADFDKDGDMDGAHFLVWQTNFFTPGGATRIDGDADLDVDVYGEDSLIWKLEFAGGSINGVGGSMGAREGRTDRMTVPDRLGFSLPAGRDRGAMSPDAEARDHVFTEFELLHESRLQALKRYSIVAKRGG